MSRWLVFVFSLCAFGTSIPQAVKLQMNAQALQDVEEILLDRLSQTNFNTRLKPMEKNIPFLVDIKMRDIEVMGKLSKIGLEFRDGGLRVKSKLRDFRINIGKLFLQYPLLNVVRLRCYELNVLMAPFQDLDLNLDLSLSVQQGSIRAHVKDFSLGWDDHQFITNGPKECQNILGMRDFISKTVLANFLPWMRPVIMASLKSKVMAFGQEIAKIIQEKSTPWYPLHMKETAYTREVNVLLGFTPEKVHITSQGMELEMGVNIEENTLKEFQGGGWPWVHLEVRPFLIQYFLNKFFKGGGPKGILAKNNEILHKRELANFWPDLDNIDPDTKFLRAYIQVTKAPILRGNALEEKLDLEFQDIEMTLAYQKDKEWKDYFVLNFSGRFLIDFVVEDGALFAKLEKKDLSIEGDWSKSHVPENRTFRKTELQWTLNFLLSSFQGQNVPINLPLARPLIWRSLGLKGQFLVAEWLGFAQ